MEEPKIIYYKLSPSGETNFETKNAALHGVDIDSNFYELKKSIKSLGDDGVVSLFFDSQGKLCLRLNDESTIISTQSYSDVMGGVNLSYNASSGTISGKILGCDVELSGITSSTSGNTEILPKYKNGSYAPIDEYFDSVSGITPSLTMQHPNGYRFMCKVSHSIFGRLFNASEALYIENQMASDGWRIPTVGEWNQMLAANEMCNENPVVANRLKTIDFWNNGSAGSNELNFNATPCGYFDPITSAIKECGEKCYFWAKDSGNTLSLKSLSYNSSVVADATPVDGAYYSLRLVKTYNGNNFNRKEKTDMSSAVICEVYTPTILLQSTSGNPSLVWFGENLNGFSTKGKDANPVGLISGDTMVTEYYVIEFNNGTYKSFVADDAMTLVIKKYNNVENYHMWEVQGNELNRIDGVGAQETIATLQEQISSLTNTVNSLNLAMSKLGFVGTEGEIKVSKQGDTYKIGFDDNATFVAF